MDTASTNYIILPKVIGHGSFGEVHLGLHKREKKLVAIKIETKDKDKDRGLLKGESSILKCLGDPSLSCLDFWEGGGKYYMVTNLLGPSLGSLHKVCGGSFSLKTTLMLAKQMIGLLKRCHDCGIIHRDIKPNNFLMEFQLPHRHVTLIDFGLSKKYRNGGEHIPYAERTQRVGSLRYMSKYSHQSVESSRRDDMYSLGYVIVYLYKGDLPWQSSEVDKIKGSKEQNDDRYSYVYGLKCNAKLANGASCYSCRQAGKPCSFPSVIKAYFDYLDSLGFADDIDYEKILTAVDDCTKAHGYSYDWVWDWNKFYLG